MSPQTELLPACHQGDPADRACLADWERGERILSCYQLEQIRLEPLSLPPGGASNSHIVWEPGPPWPRTALHAVCPLSSSGHPSYH